MNFRYRWQLGRRDGPILRLALLALVLPWLNPSFATTQEMAGEAAQGQYRGAKVTEHPAWFKESFLDFEEDIAEAADAGKRLLLYFYQDGCPYCNRLVEHNFGQPEIERFTRANFDLVAINMWGDRDVVTVGGRSFTEKTLAAALKVNYTPTLLFFNERRKVALRINGYYPPEKFLHALRYVAARKEDEMSLREYIAGQVRPTAPAGELFAEPFFMSPPFDLAANRAAATRPLAVFFEQPGCADCRLLHEKVLVDATTRELVQQFDTVQLDIWADTPLVTPSGAASTARQWAAGLGLDYAPSVVFFDLAGREVMRIEALLKTFHTQSVFAYVLEQGYLSEPSFQRYLSARADRLIEQGIDVDIDGY